MNQVKQKRISAEINRCLFEIIINETSDELLKNITITDCEVSNDLSYCKVFFTSLLDKTQEELERELNDNTSKYLRGHLSQKVELRHTPKLVFKYDNSIAEGQKIETIISKIHQGE